VRNVAVRDVVSIVGKPEKPLLRARWQTRCGWDAAANFVFDPHATLVRSQLTRPKVSDRAK